MNSNVNKRIERSTAGFGLVTPPTSILELRCPQAHGQRCQLPGDGPHVIWRFGRPGYIVISRYFGYMHASPLCVTRCKFNLNYTYQLHCFFNLRRLFACVHFYNLCFRSYWTCSGSSETASLNEQAVCLNEDFVYNFIYIPPPTPHPTHTDTQKPNLLSTQ